MNTKAELIDRQKVILLFGENMTLRRFKRTSLYSMLRKHEHRLHRRLTVYGRTALNKTLKEAGYEYEF